MADLVKVGWKPRDLVGPDTVPSLITLENNVELALNTHIHGGVSRYEGEVVFYEAAPIETSRIPIVDANNTVNSSLAMHMQDSVIHTGGGLAAQELLVYQGTINLIAAVDTYANYEDGNVTDSWVSQTPMANIKPEQSGHAYNTGSGGPDVWRNNVFNIESQGLTQRFLLREPFSTTAPTFGRHLQRGFYGWNADGWINGGGHPNVIAFDYLLFPFRTWYNLQVKSDPYRYDFRFDRTVLKRNRFSFPGGYRVPQGRQDKVRLHTQLRGRLTHSYDASMRFEEYFWPKTGTVNDDGTPLGIYPTNVPGLGVYATDPNNHQRNFVETSGEPDTNPYQQNPAIIPDMSNFRYGNAWASAARHMDMWADYKTKYAGGANYGKADTMMPLDELRQFSMRVMYEFPDDQNIDVFPLCMVGFMVILPFGYLPLYCPTATTPLGAGSGAGEFENSAAMYMKTPLEFAPAGASLYWEDWAGGWKVPRASFLAPFTGTINVANDNWFQLSGDIRTYLRVGGQITVSGGTAHDGVYTIASFGYDSSNHRTTITVEGAGGIVYASPGGTLTTIVSALKYGYPYPKELSLDFLARIPNVDL